MTERQDVAAAPAPFPGAGGSYPAAPGQVMPAAKLPGGDEQSAPAGQGSAVPASAPAGSSSPVSSPGPVSSSGSALRGQAWTFGQASHGTPGPAAGRGTEHPVPGSAEPEDEPHVRVDARKLEAALLGLRKPLVSIPLVLDAPGVAEARAERLKLLGQIDDYLLPRLRQSGAPILVALVGSTGAGKSTLMNSLVGRQVSATGIRRPTTNSPVLACHPNDMRWFAENVFLPTLPRVRQQGLAMPGRDGLLVLAASEGMPEGVAVLDTPDIDSVVQAHRDFAHQFLDASDLWLFVTTARRYADAAVWEMLKDARDRGAALAIALSRVPPMAAPELRAHFEAMLDANGLQDVRRFIIPETIVTEAQLPPEIAAPVKDYLTDTARRDDRRVAVLTQTMSGVLDTFRDRVPALADQAGVQLAARSELQAATEGAYAAASLLCGEVLARWQDFAGTGDLLRSLQSRRGRGSGGKSKVKKERLPTRASALKAALRASLESLVSSTADRAAEQSVASWQETPAGAALLARLIRPGPGAGGEDAVLSEPEFVRAALADLGVTDGSAAIEETGLGSLSRASAGLALAAAQAIDGWQEYVQQIVREENVTKRSIARVVSFDQESLALVLTIGVLGYGASEVPVTAGTSAVPQRVLTALFGAGLLRDIGVRVRLDLHDRVSGLFESEARRFTALVAGAGALDENVAAELLQAGFTLESAR
jgi:energy-coupling factor transporter ATP-binding protein EcfA2